jgi:two-component system cell cycle sensor histidine kinase/response regulator CckA
MILDLVMPGLSGLDTLRLARRSRPDLKVLFASGYADLSRFGDTLGSYPLLKKPFKPETLAEAVHTATQRVSPDELDNVVPLRRDQQ